MLKPAILYSNELNAVYQTKIYASNYKFLIEDIWDYSIKIDNSDEYKIQLVSIDNKKVIGYFEACLDRKFNKVTSLEVINFTVPCFKFSKDFHVFIIKLKKQFRKINFEAIVGSPGEKIYDSHLKKYNARMVGVLKDEVKLTDGKFYDVKIYEIIN